MSINTIGVRVGINAIACPVCQALAKRQKRYHGVINTVFIPVSFVEHAAMSGGSAMNKSGICQGDAQFGQHEVTFVLRVAGNLTPVEELI